MPKPPKDGFDFAEYDNTVTHQADIAHISEQEMAFRKLLVSQLDDVEATQKKKQRFVDKIIEEMPFVLGYAQDGEKLREKKKELKKSSQTLKKHVTEFHKLLLQLRGQIQGNLCAAHVINPRITNDCDLVAVIEYLNIFQKELSSLNIPDGKGRHNLSGQSVGEFLYKSFKQAFGKPPQSGKGRQPYKNKPTQITGYDKLCKIIADYYNVEISYDARTLSWKARKKSGHKSKK